MTLLAEVKAHYGKIQNYINGSWVDSSSEHILNIINPATARVIGEVPLSTDEEVENAVNTIAFHSEEIPAPKFWKNAFFKNRSNIQKS